MKIHYFFLAIVIKYISNSLNDDFRSLNNLSDDSVQLYQEMKDNINCPICLDLLKDPVECKECSGNVCKLCQENHRLQDCSICRSKEGFRPSLNTIKFLDLLKFDCKFKNIGCDVKSCQSNLNGHIKNCKSTNELIKLLDDKDMQIKILKFANEKNISELKTEHNSTVRMLEKQISELKNKNMELENILKNKEENEKIKDVIDGKYLDTKIDKIKILKYSSAHQFIGQTEYKNVLSGFGILKNSKDELYIGQFNNNSKNGYGMLIQPNNSIQIGEFINNESTGYGLYKENDHLGIGTFNKNKKLNDYGMIKDQKSKHIKIGKFNDNIRNGVGLTNLDDDSGLYLGMFTDNKRNGNGLYRWVVGNYFIGNWNDNLIDGLGVYQQTSGKIEIGDFKTKNNKLILESNNQTKEVNDEVQVGKDRKQIE